MSAPGQYASGDDARRRLREAATEAFAARGFHGTSTRDIAAVAGLSPAALYVHHQTKEHLLYEISLDGHRRTLALVEEAAGRTDDPVGRLRAVVACFVSFHAEEHVSCRVVNYELDALDPEHRAEILEVRDGIEALFRDVIDRGVAAGDLRTPDPAMAAVVLSSLGIDVARWYHDGGRWSPEQVGEFYADHVVRMFSP